MSGPPRTELLDGVLTDAEEAFAKYDDLRDEMRRTEARIRVLCRTYDLATGSHGVRPEGVRRAIQARRVPAA